MCIERKTYERRYHLGGYLEFKPVLCGLDHDTAIGGPGKGKQRMPLRKRCNLQNNKLGGD